MGKNSEDETLGFCMLTLRERSLAWMSPSAGQGGVHLLPCCDYAAVLHADT